MLAMGYSLKVIVETLSKEYNCLPETIYHDYSSMHVWVHVVEPDKQLTSILRARLNQINDEALALRMENDGEQKLNTKDKIAKICALKSALKGMVEQVRLTQELRLEKCKRLEISEKLSAVTPFEADPMLKEALLASVAKQKIEKVERDAAKGSDAPRR